MNKRIYLLIAILIFFSGACTNKTTERENLVHPKLVSTSKGMQLIRDNLGKYPLIENSIQEMMDYVDKELLMEIDIPIPLDPSGGYTHKKHKSNYLAMYRAAMLYQVLGEEKYADYVKVMLLGYTRLIPKIGLHPNGKSYSPGKLFWQALNDAMWLIHVVQAYDCIYYELSVKERAQIESGLLRPMADFLSIGSPKMFNRVHNHGIWLNAAVGMTGYALGDEELVKRALYGAEIDKTLETFKAVDYNDPALKGFDENRPAGYFMQLDNLFSPEGYYTEGPYYQRFSLWPFMLMAQTIENNDPEIKIFDYRNSIIKKALYTALQLSYTNGDFFPFNDALKGMAITSPELTLALNIGYEAYEEDPALLDIAQRQNQIVFTKGGFMVAKHVAENKAQPFHWKTINLSDGAQGKQGGVALLRNGRTSDQICLVMRYTSHGLAHGHYDKLSQLLYDNGNEILQDYGAARYVNVIQKRGGRYLPENTTWAKQTIAHNTVVLDQKSHFNGDINTSSQYHPELYHYDDSNPAYQIISAKVDEAYKGVEMHRTMVLVTDGSLRKPFVLDIFNVTSEQRHQMDLPFHYLGEIIDLQFDYKAMTDGQKPLGSKNGYQHLWLQGKGKTEKGQAQFTWLNDDRFYTLTTATDNNTELLICRLGANDPEFNLRPDPAFIVRQKNVGHHTFISTVEPHGSKNPVNELTSHLYGEIKTLNTLFNNGQYVAVEIGLEDKKYLALLSLRNNKLDAAHSLSIKDNTYKWNGVFKLQKLN